MVGGCVCPKRKWAQVYNIRAPLDNTWWETFWVRTNEIFGALVSTGRVCFQWGYPVSLGKTALNNTMHGNLSQREDLVTKSS